ncbi:alpha/beta fold hydrolase [Prosthecomicrobium sp. N25]|uniref:alpha/beta fold hydrolase n=1 Tax=Prosthecomicrobium sp. N25 TaxID=3129254 RepID=UPI00307786C1
MEAFLSDGLPIAFLDEGPRDGDPIVLVHGFASTANVNWVFPGWTKLLAGDGRRVIALDNRGHGESGKSYDPRDYHSRTRMAEDVLRLLDHLEIGRADVMGYSMGAWITAYLALDHPERVRSAIFGGLADAMVKGIAGQETIAEALETEDEASIVSPKGRAYRAFAIQTRSDRRALAACMRGSRQPVPPEELARLSMPVLIAVGTKDDVAGSPEALAALIPHARVLPIPDRDHMLAVGDKVYKQGVLDFLGERP